MSNLTEYLLELAADPDRSSRFKADAASDPGFAMLNERERIAVGSRNSKEILAVIAELDQDSGIVLQWLYSLFQPPAGST